jgi:hypothetical protein
VRQVVVLQRQSTRSQLSDGPVEVVDDEEGGGVLGTGGWTLVQGEHGAVAGAVHHPASQMWVAWLRPADGHDWQAEGCLIETSSTDEIGGRQ